MPRRHCACCARTFLVLTAACPRRFCSPACYCAATAALPDYPEREFRVLADGWPEPPFVTAELQPPKMPWESESTKGDGLDWLERWRR